PSAPFTGRLSVKLSKIYYRVDKSVKMCYTLFNEKMRKGEIDMLDALTHGEIVSAILTGILFAGMLLIASKLDGIKKALQEKK
ncbi:hypothetical protein ACFL29_02445, partial [Patescibacteria group bacterium]